MFHLDHLVLFLTAAQFQVAFCFDGIYFILISFHFFWSVMTSLKGKGCEDWRCIQSQLFKSTLLVTCPDVRSAESLQLVSDPRPAGFK